MRFFGNHKEADSDSTERVRIRAETLAELQDVVVDLREQQEELVATIEQLGEPVNARKR